MGTWPIIKLAVEHCIAAVAVGALFAGSTYLLSLMFPNSAVLWWMGKIDLVLAIITPTAMAAIFISSLGRIVYNAVVSVWKGASNVNLQSMLA